MIPIRRVPISVRLSLTTPVIAELVHESTHVDSREKLQSKSFILYLWLPTIRYMRSRSSTSIGRNNVTRRVTSMSRVCVVRGRVRACACKREACLSLDPPEQGTPSGEVASVDEGVQRGVEVRIVESTPSAEVFLIRR